MPHADSQDLEIWTLDERGDPVEAKLYVSYEFEDMEHCDEYDSSGGSVTITLPDAARPLFVVGVPKDPGYWNVRLESIQDGDALTFPYLPPLGEQAWWLDCTGVDVAESSRGTGIKIGIVDSDFRPGYGLDDVNAIQPNGPFQSPMNWGHGEAICRIIGDRSEEAESWSVAPGADIVFIDASTKSGEIHPASAIAAIYELIAVHEVDVINLSWGVYLEFADEKIDLPGITDVIELAAELGVLVIAAAGNDASSGDVAFPAVLPECIAVGGMGALDCGPEGSVERWYAETASSDLLFTANGGACYAWRDGSFGAGLNALAPAVGIVFQRDGAAAYDVCGTSFAAPVATGIAAIALAKNRDYFRQARSSARTQLARDEFFGMCRPCGLDPERQGSGYVCL